MDVVAFYEEYSTPLNFLFGALNFFLGVLLDYRFRLGAKLRRWWARRRRALAELSLTVAYASHLPFEEVKKNIRHAFGGASSFQLHRDSALRFSFQYEEFALTVAQGENGILLSVHKVAVPMKNFERRLRRVVAAIERAAQVPAGEATVAGAVRYCDAQVALPYEWSRLHLQTPGGYRVTQSAVTLQDADSGAEIDVRGTELRIRTTSAAAMKAALADVL